MEVKQKAGISYQIADKLISWKVYARVSGLLLAGTCKTLHPEEETHNLLS